MDGNRSEPRVVPIIVKGRGGTAAFGAVRGETLLEAALRQGADVPYSCGSGSCGLCKVRVTSGEVTKLWRDAPGYGPRPKPDEALLCQCEVAGPGPEGRLELAINGASDTLSHVDTRASRFAARVLRAEPLGESLLEIELVLDRPIRYAAGQFGLFYFPGIRGGRAFSFAAPPTDGGCDRVLLVVKRKPGGPATTRLFGPDAAGSEVEMFGPLGLATFDPVREGDIICVVGGSGLSLGLSIMGAAALAGHFATRRGLLVVGMRRATDLASLQPLAAIAETAGRGLRIVVALSDEGAAAAARADWAVPSVEVVQGFAHDAMRAAMAGDYAGRVAYVAGPPPMIQAVQRALLLEGRLPAADIRCDTFY